MSRSVSPDPWIVHPKGGFFGTYGKTRVSEGVRNANMSLGFAEARAKSARNEENQRLTMAGDSLQARRQRMRAARLGEQ